MIPHLRFGAVVRLWLVALLALGGCGDSKPSAIGSPDGSVAFGKMAFSPDGKMYAREVEPKDRGNIGIYTRSPDKLVTKISVKQHPGGFSNEIKGLAWSSDSKRVAVMYHYGKGGHISLVSVDRGAEIKSVPIEAQYHHLEFSRDGRSIFAGGTFLEIGDVK
jgi:WD40 repeat protein